MVTVLQSTKPVWNQSCFIFSCTWSRQWRWIALHGEHRRICRTPGESLRLRLQDTSTAFGNNSSNINIKISYVLPHAGFRYAQISAMRGPDSRFVVEANTKSRWPKSSRSRIVKLVDRGGVTRPRVKYRVEYQILGEFLIVFALYY